jgi:hypothetical protein
MVYVTRKIRPQGAHWVGGWVGPRTGLDEVEKRKILSLRGLEIRSLVHPLTRRHSDCALLASLRRRIGELNTHSSYVSTEIRAFAFHRNYEVTAVFA